MRVSPFNVVNAQDFLFPAAVTTLYLSRQTKPRYSGVLCGPVPHWTVTPYSVAFFVALNGGMMIKAIETVYNGYKFRSRLEARWAVFFDALGIEYQYEVEGFDLDGTWYLPDFWLPEQKWWIEIKPKVGNVDHGKLIRLSNQPAMVILLQGNVWFDEYRMDVFYAGNKFWVASGSFVLALQEPAWKLGIVLQSQDGSELYWASSEVAADRQYFWPTQLYHELSYDGLIDRLMHAYTAARQARF